MVSQVNSRFAQELRVYNAAVSANTQLESVPIGRVLEMFKVVNTTANAVTINIGTSATGDQLVSGLVIGANAVETVNVGAMYSLSVAKDIYISSAAWNAAVLKVEYNCAKLTMT